MPPFLPQATLRVPDNADLTRPLNLLADNVGGAVRDIRNANQLRELGAAAQGGDLNRLRDVAFGQGRIDLGLSADQRLEARQNRAEDVAYRNAQAARSQANADRAYKLDLARLDQARTAAEKDYELRKWTAQTGFDVELKKIAAKANKLSDVLTPGQKKADEEFGKEFVEWNASGGFADVEKQLGQLEEVATRLEAGEDLNSWTMGVAPDWVLALTEGGRKAINARDLVQEVAQRNLRAILGGQFAQKEGEQLINRAYNPILDEAQNARRLRALIRQMRSAAQQKQAATDYFAANGTLVGFEGGRPSLGAFNPESQAAPGRTDAPPPPDGFELVNP